MHVYMISLSHPLALALSPSLSLARSRSRSRSPNLIYVLLLFVPSLSGDEEGDRRRLGRRHVRAHGRQR